MAHRDQRRSQGRPRKRRAAPRRVATPASILALRRAKEQLLKLRITTPEILAAIREIDAGLEPYEAQDRKFEVSLVAVIEMKADCADLRHQVARAMMEYITNGLHLDANYLAEVIHFKEVI